MTTDESGVGPGVHALALAIAHAEGYGIPGTIPTRANNPGDLVETTSPKTRPTLGTERISVYATAADGWRALHHQLQLIADGRSHVYRATDTFADMARKWTSTDVGAWLGNVIDHLQNQGFDVDESSPLADVLLGDV